MLLDLPLDDLTFTTQGGDASTQVGQIVLLSAGIARNLELQQSLALANLGADIGLQVASACAQTLTVDHIKNVTLFYGATLGYTLFNHDATLWGVHPKHAARRKKLSADGSASGVAAEDKGCDHRRRHRQCCDGHQCPGQARREHDTPLLRRVQFLNGFVAKQRGIFGVGRGAVHVR